jgi:8-oxo-dGTP pyrophosphatase MutT (NUDIX family)
LSGRPFELAALRAALGIGAELGIESEARSAAVAVIARESTRGAELLLIRRAERQGDPWSGQMAFPGGRHEPFDVDLRATAERETREEIGLDLAEHARFIGALPRVPATARGVPVGMVVAPLVFELSSLPALSLGAEVAEVVWAPLGAIASGSLDTTFTYVHEGNRYQLPALDVEGRVVWGLTYRMLRSLFEAIAGER